MSEYNEYERQFLICIKPSKIWEGIQLHPEVRVEKLVGTSGGGLAITFNILFQDEKEYYIRVNELKEVLV